MPLGIPLVVVHETLKGVHHSGLASFLLLWRVVTLLVILFAYTFQRSAQARAFLFFFDRFRFAFQNLIVDLLGLFFVWRGFFGDFYGWRFCLTARAPGLEGCDKLGIFFDFVRRFRLNLLYHWFRFRNRRGFLGRIFLIGSWLFML